MPTVNLDRAGIARDMDQGHNFHLALLADMAEDAGDHRLALGYRWLLEWKKSPRLTHSVRQGDGKNEVYVRWAKWFEGERWPELKRWHATPRPEHDVLPEDVTRALLRRRQTRSKSVFVVYKNAARAIGELLAV